MKLTIHDLIYKGKWEDYCLLKKLDPHTINRGELDDMSEIVLSPEEIKTLGLSPKTSVCGDSGN